MKVYLHRTVPRGHREVGRRSSSNRVAVGVAAFVALALLSASLWMSGAQASSLWSPTGSLYSDTKARRVGDLVTIIIVERSQATQSASTKTGSDGQVQVGPLALADIVPVVPQISRERQ